MVHLFENKKGFICNICREFSSNEDKCFIMIRKRNSEATDGRVQLQCNSATMCTPCFNKIKKFIISLEKVRGNAK